jgi:hypothetical protein
MGLNGRQCLADTLGYGSRRDLYLLNHDRGNHRDATLAVKHRQQFFHNPLAIDGLTQGQACREHWFRGKLSLRSCPD